MKEGFTLKLIANAVGVVAVALFLLSYQQKTRKNIITLNALSRALYILQYLLLGAYSGAVLDVLGIAVSLIAQHKTAPFIARHQRGIVIGINLLFLVAGVVFYQNIFSLFSLTGVMLHTNAFWMVDERKIRIVSLSGSPFWLVYNLAAGAFGSATGDLLSILSIVTAMIRYDIRPKGKNVR